MSTAPASLTTTREHALALLAEPAPIELHGRTLANVLDEITADRNGRPLIDVRATGVGILDETAGGLVAGEFLGIAAGPGVGKSLLADRLTLGVLERNPTARALVFALETATVVRVARLLCGQSVEINEHGGIARYVPLGDLLRGELDADSLARARATAERLRGLIGDRLTFVDDVAAAEGIAERIRVERPTVAVIDHFGLVHADIRNAGAVEQFDYGIRVVADAIREAGTRGIFIAEVTKSTLSTGELNIGSVRGSARFASLAGQLLTLERNGDGDAITLRLEKNRHGRAMVEQAGKLFGGLAYIAVTGRVESIKRKPKREGKRQGGHDD